MDKGRQEQKTTADFPATKLGIKMGKLELWEHKKKCGSALSLLAVLEIVALGLAWGACLAWGLGQRIM